MINQLALEIMSSDTLKFGALFVFLLYYVLKTSEKREEGLKDHIKKADESLSEVVTILKMMKVDLSNKMEKVDEKMGRIDEKLDRLEVNKKDGA